MILQGWSIVIYSCWKNDISLFVYQALRAFEMLYAFKGH